MVMDEFRKPELNLPRVFSDDVVVLDLAQTVNLSHFCVGINGGTQIEHEVMREITSAHMHLVLKSRAILKLLCPPMHADRSGL